MPTRTGSKKKKQVGFSSTTTKIEAPAADHKQDSDAFAFTLEGKQMMQKSQEFYQSKATEFESCKRIPRFSKPFGAVIHPIDPKVHKEPQHKPPKTLQFDGSPVKPVKRPEFHADKGLPEHLVRPPVDAEKLLQIRARAKLRKLEQSNISKKKMSMEAQKTQKASAKLKSDINIKIKGAEKNLKQIFSEFKTILDKSDSEQVIAGGSDMVSEAKQAEFDGRLCSFMFNAWKNAASRQRNDDDGRIMSTSFECVRHDFVKFVKQFLGSQFSGDKASDIFMHYLQEGSQLRVILRQISDAMSPHASKIEGADDTQSQFGRPNKNSPTRSDDYEPNCDPTNPLQFSIRTYGLKENERDNMFISFEAIENAYNEWAKDDNKVGELTNQKLVAPKNKDYQSKLKSWAARHNERKTAKKKTVQYEKQLWEFFNKEMPFKKDLQMVNRCRDDLHRLIEDMKTKRKDNKIINNFLKDMSLDKLSHSVQTDDLDKALANRKVIVTAKLHLVDDFVESIKMERALQKDYFNFFELPDHVARRNYTRTEYEGTILKMMMRVKDAWLAKKQKDNPGEQVTITDHDLTPIELFEVVASQIKNKITEQTSIISKFITDSKNTVQATIDKVKDQFTEKTRRTIEHNFFVDMLNSRMDKSNIEYFTMAFQIRNLYIAFIKKTEKDGEYSSAVSFAKAFDEVFRCMQTGNKYFNEFEKKRNAESIKFSGKQEEMLGSETASQFYRSEPSSATRRTDRTPQRAKSRGRSGDSLGSSPEKQRSEAGSAARSDKNTEERAMEEDAKSMDLEEAANKEMDEEDQQEAEAALEAERRKKASGESDYPEFFVYTKSFAPKPGQEGERFIPMKRFGNIESEKTLIHDRITSSYVLNMPTEVYQKLIIDTLPKKEDGDGKWFIRPHHLENLTKHPKSICDDLLNSRYYSHYNLDFNKQEPENIAQKAVERIEQHLDRLKGQMYEHMKARGQEPDVIHDQLYEQVGREAMEEYDKFIGDRTRVDNKKQIVDAYEEILTFERGKERDLLNDVRHDEHEKNRPPAHGWYELKDQSFSKELYRNRVALKPNNTNAVYLANLMDRKLY